MCRAGEQTCYIKTLPTFLRFSDLRKLEFSRVGFSGAGRARTLAPVYDWLLSEPEPGCDGSESWGKQSPGYTGEFCSQDRRELETGDYCQHSAAAAFSPGTWILLIFVLEIARHRFYSLLAPSKLCSDSASQIPGSLP